MLQNLQTSYLKRSSIEYCPCTLS